MDRSWFERTIEATAPSPWSHPLTTSCSKTSLCRLISSGVHHKSPGSSSGSVESRSESSLEKFLRSLPSKSAIATLYSALNWIYCLLVVKMILICIIHFSDTLRPLECLLVARYNLNSRMVFASRYIGLLVVGTQLVCRLCILHFRPDFSFVTTHFVLFDCKIPPAEARNRLRPDQEILEPPPCWTSMRSTSGRRQWRTGAAWTTLRGS